MKRIRFIDETGMTRTGEYSEGEIRAAGRNYDLKDVDVRPPCEPSKVVGVAGNSQEILEEHDADPPERPLLFLMAPNTLAGHGDTVRLLPDIDFDFEAELGVIIGEQCFDVSEADAESKIAGYTCVNDITNGEEEGYQGIRLKSFDNGTPVGPVMATPDSVPDDASIELRLDGELRQQTTKSKLVFSPPEIVSEVTSYMTLNRGDLITMGTTTGVDSLRGAEEVEISIDGIGTLRHGIRE